MTYNTWFLPIRPLELDDQTLKVQIPSQFFWEWIDEHYSSLLHKVLSEVIGQGAKLAYVINDELTKVKQEGAGEVSLVAPVIPQPKVTKEKTKTFDSHLNPRYRFDNFIKGEGNELARAAAGAI